MTPAWAISLLVEGFAVYALRESRLRWLFYFLAFDLSTSFIFVFIPQGVTLYGTIWMCKAAIIMALWLAVLWELVLLEADNWPAFIAHVLAPALVLAVTSAALLGAFDLQVVRPSASLLHLVMEARRSMAGALSAAAALLSVVYFAMGRQRVSVLHGATLALYFGVQAWGYLVGTAMKPADWEARAWHSLITSLHQAALGACFLVMGFVVAREAKDPARVGSWLSLGRASRSAKAHRPEPSEPRLRQEPGPRA